MNKGNVEMDPVDRSILETYDELKREVLDLHSLFELAGGHAPVERLAVLDHVGQLVTQGLLRPGDGGDFYERTEDGRLAVAGPLDVTLYTRDGCPLCDAALAAMTPLLAEFGATLHEVNIDRDATLREEYTNDVPVILLGQQEVARHRLDAVAFRRALEQAKT
jgi:glutaredoxin